MKLQESREEEVAAHHDPVCQVVEEVGANADSAMVLTQHFAVCQVVEEVGMTKSQTKDYLDTRSQDKAVACEATPTAHL